MRDKAINASDFFWRFPNGETARKHLEHLRWSNNPVCPRCAENNRISKRKRIGFYRCLSCKKDFTVRTGTIFAKSNVKLHKWFYAVYLLMTTRKSIPSLQLSKEISVSQPTAWFMGQRIYEACGGDYSKLSGTVKVDEIYIGDKGKHKNINKRSNKTRIEAAHRIIKDSVLKCSQMCAKGARC